MSHLHMLFIICPLVFFAGVVDSIAGGGGLISLPAYYAIGLPPKMALATNKFSAAIGTSFSVFMFAKNKKIDYKVGGIGIVFSFIGSSIGSRLALVLPDIYLRYTLLIAIPIIAVFSLRNKNFLEKKVDLNLSRKNIIILSAVTGFVIGTYDGFFGPGTGTFYILIYTTVFGYDAITASGNAKIVNLSSGYAAVITFIMSKQILYSIAIPAAICGIAGNWLGSGLALKKGAKVIKPVFTFVLVLLLIKVASDIFLTK